MDEIKRRLKQLEDVGTGLLAERQATIQRRLREDEALHLKRKEEDQTYSQSLKERDQEEDELRQQQRALNRSSISNLMLNNPNTVSAIASASSNPISKPLPKPNIKAAKSSSGSHKASKIASHGLPIAHDSQGRALHVRPSDGKLVYLRCIIPNCERTNFETVLSLRSHVSAPKHHHKIEGVFMGNSHAIEICGEIAPGQDNMDYAGANNDGGVAPVAIMTKRGLIPSTSISSSRKKSEGTSTGSASGTLIGSDEGTHVNIRDLGRSYRASSVSGYTGSRQRLNPRTLACEIPVTRGLMSENKDEGNEVSRMPLAEMNHNRLANKGTPPGNHLLGGIDLFSLASNVAAQDNMLPMLGASVVDVKGEHEADTSLFSTSSPPHNSPSDTTISKSEATNGHVLLQNNGAVVQKVGTGDNPNNKRTASAEPSTPLQRAKRARTKEEPSSV